MHAHVYMYVYMDVCRYNMYKVIRGGKSERKREKEKEINR